MLLEIHLCFTVFFCIHSSWIPHHAYYGKFLIFHFFFFFLKCYGPFSLALASLIINAHSSLSNAFVLHRFTPSFLKSPSTSFIHLSLGRPVPILPSNFPSMIFTDLVSFILITCPSHFNLRIYITVTISWDLYLVINSALVLIPTVHSPLLVHLFSSTSFSPMSLTFFQFYLSQSMSLLHMSQLVL